MSNTQINIGVINQASVVTQTQVGKLLFTDEGKQYIIKSDGSKLKFTDILFVSALPITGLTEILYILTTDSSINYYDTIWKTAGGKSQIEKVSVLPSTNIDTNKLYLLSTDKSINAYDGTSWTKYGGSSSGNIGTKQVDETGLNNGMIPVFDTTSGKYKPQAVFSGSANPTGNGISQPLSSISMAQGDTQLLNHVGLTNNKVYFDIFEEILGGNINDTHNNFSSASNYILQDTNKLTFTGNKSQLKSGASCINAYKFEETSGTVCTDSKGLYNGVYHGTTSVTGLSGIGYARQFNGTSDYISYSNPVIPYNKDFTIKFDFKKTGFPTHYETLITNRNSNGLEVNINTSGVLTLNYFVAYPTGNGSFTYNISSYLDGIKHTIVFKYIHATKTIYLYIDDLVNSKANLTFNSALTVVGDLNFMVGYNNYTNYYYQGILDNLEIYNEAVDFSIANTNPTNLKTSNLSNYALSTINTINSLTIPVTVPTNTSIKILTSFDGRTNWLYRDGTGWHKYTGDLTIDWASSNSNTELQSYFTNLTITQLTTDLSSLGITPTNIDFSIQFITTDITTSPVVSSITMNYLSNSRYEQATIGKIDSTADYGLQRLSNSQTLIKRQSVVIGGTSSNVIVNMFDGSGGSGSIILGADEW